MVDCKWQILFSKRAKYEAKKISAAGLKEKVHTLLDILKKDPFKYPPSYKKLSGDLFGFYSRRINLYHRLVYEIYEMKKIIYVHSMLDHYRISF